MKKLMLLLFALVCLVGGELWADSFRVTLPNRRASLTKAPAFAVQTLTDGQVTPNIALGTVIITGINTATTDIKGFSGALPGQVLTLIGGGATTSNATTISDSGAFRLAGAFTLSAHDSIVLLVRGNGDYVELSRSNN